MKIYLLIILSSVICITQKISSQEISKASTITLFTGVMNYQGDLNPNSFTFRNSNFSVGLMYKKPLSRWFTLRLGAQMGNIESADSKNRNYLQQRNLSFFTSVIEANGGLELLLMNPEKNRLVPYLYTGIAVFKFNPWTYDNDGNKTFLQPLGTEGQGIYPDKKMYKLTQMALPFGGGIKYALNDAINIGVEFSQRKSFTDYIDDVSGSYPDMNDLLQARGTQAVELSYRGDEVAGGSPDFPDQGEQRGTPSEMDWYYFLGTTIEIKLSLLKDIFAGKNGMHGNFRLRCPANVY